MTEGSIVPHLASFAVPLMFGNLFQQLYNAVDTWVVGNYVSNEAFSAIGTISPIIMVVIGFFIGISSGISVVVSQYFGAKEYGKVHETVHTSFLLTFLLGIVLAFAGNSLCTTFLNLMQMPAQSFQFAEEYLRIYFFGILFQMLYNTGAGILRAVGDSKRPFYFLVVSAVLNVILDLIFVLKLGWGVAGVAYATVVSQFVAAALTMFALNRSKDCTRLTFSALKFETSMLKRIVKTGFPTGLQLSITSLSNIFVQSYINYFGTDFMSGWAAYMRIQPLVFLPLEAIVLASSTFVGQNLGANQIKRAKKGVTVAFVMALASTLLISIPCMVFAPKIIAFFNGKREVIEYGALILRRLQSLYCLQCIMQVYLGALRGTGNTRAPLIIMLSTLVGFRQLYLHLIVTYSNTMTAVVMSHPAGWMACSIVTMIYYKRFKFASYRITGS